MHDRKHEWENPMQPPIPNPNAFSPGPTPGGPLSSDDKNWGMACHLAAFCMYLGVPFGNVIGPLLVWLFKKDSSAFINEQGKESLNFQLSMTLYGLIGGAIAAFLALSIIGIPLLILAFPLVLVFGIAHLILTVMGTIRSANGEIYRYPMTIRFVS
ncbi:MAG TPA: DUF4870 domain-containing protein [Abditibacteriaceae bacterium]|jgi:hypothetical protein